MHPVRHSGQKSDMNVNCAMNLHYAANLEMHRASFFKFFDGYPFMGFCMVLIKCGCVSM